MVADPIMRKRTIEPFTTKHAAKSMLLASVKRCREEDVWWIPEGKKSRPLNCFKKIAQACKSARASLFRFLWWLGLWRPRVRSIIRRRNVLPGGTTAQAKFREPISDCNWCKVAVRLFWNNSILVFNSSNLSVGSLTSNLKAGDDLEFLPPGKIGGV